MPVVGAFIGWFTNYIAVKMLFHPREALNILGITVQGVFPRRQAALAEKLGKVVSEQLITAQEIGEQIASPATKQKVRTAVEGFLDTAIRERLPVAVPMVAMFLSPQLIETVKGAFASDLDSLIDSTLANVGGSLASTLDIKGLVQAKVAGFSSDRLEELLIEIMKREFTFIEIIGGFLGATIGLVQACLVQ